ncbi:MAG: hypothetical protein QGF99_02435 [Acidimicrobiales bacterium]|nr:hypothetical protein [Acidimicrobiales bacterium]
MTFFRRRFRGNQQQQTRCLPPLNWVQPWWVHRWREQNQQIAINTPQSNKVARSWTLLGNLDSSERIAVDRRGLVAVRPGSWSLDWWLRVDDDWIFPSEHGAVRQRLIDGAPVVETVIRAAGGDLIHRVYVARADSEYLVVEVDNQATRPVALAWAIRPYDHLGGGRVENIELDDRTLHVDGQVGVICGRTPGRFITGSGGIDPALSLDTTEGGPKSVVCEQGMASAALITPLVHGATLRCMVPLGTSPDSQPTSKIPTASQVARGWGHHAVNASRFVLPAGHVNDVFDASRQSLLLASTGEDLVPAPGGPPHTASDEAAVLIGLAECGYEAAVRQILISRAKRQDRMGAVIHNDIDVTSATLAAAGRALEIAPDTALSEALSEFAADGARWILANPDPSAREGLLSANRILKSVGADKAVRELEELIPSVIVPDTQKSHDTGDVNVLEMAKSAFDQLATDPETVFAKMEQLASLASPTMNWPTCLDPSTKNGTAGAGHDLRVSAWFVRSLLRLLVDDTGDQLRFALVWPKEWLGLGAEVHGLPTRYGNVSWAVRWHADRPAVLWEVDGGPTNLKVQVPGLDPQFEGEGPVGEELLSPVGHAIEMHDSDDADPEPPASGTFS